MPLPTIIIKDQKIDMLGAYKYLGTIIDNKLNFNAGTESIYKKGPSKNIFLQRLLVSNVDRKMVTLSFIESMLSLSLIPWFPPDFHISFVRLWDCNI